MMNLLVYGSIALLSLVVPMGIFVGRNNVRSTRGQLVDDLANLFSFAKEQGGTPLIVPSFELVKYKYDAARDTTRIGSWAIPVFVYVVLSYFGFVTAFASLPIENLGNSFLLVGKQNVKVGELIGTLTYAFLGGYIWTIQYLIRRVANFDLKPLSFLRCAAHILFGGFVTAAAWHAVGLFGADFTMPAPLGFLVGMYPSLMLEKLMARFSFLQMRRVNEATKAICEEVPLDTVSGIDPYIKFRLAEFEIEDVQNLATTNPIQLFVETPYGLYESIDWVAQAQLILAVGTAKTIQLRQINIRTIFDLEKALFNPFSRRRLLAILVPGMTSEESELALQAATAHFAATDADTVQVGSAPADPPWWTGHLQSGSSEIVLDCREFLQSIVAMLRDDLHVMRLRQIWDVIRGRLVKRPYIAKPPIAFPRAAE